MRQRPLNAVLLLLSLSAVILGFALAQTPAYADGDNPPPPHRDTGDTTGSGSSVPDYPLGSGESNLSSEAEPDLWDVVLSTLKAII
jgi:hypothetical protein